MIPPEDQEQSRPLLTTGQQLPMLVWPELGRHVSLPANGSFRNHSMHGRSQDFSKRGGGGGGHTDSYRGYSSDCHLNIVSCLLTRRLTKGGSRAPQDPPTPWLRLCNVKMSMTNSFHSTLY